MMNNTSNEQTARFNIALIPENKHFIAHNIKLAQDNFASQAQEYLLGDNAWPHITLCQFEANPDRLPEIWSAVMPLASKPLSIHLGPFYILLYEGYYWVGLSTRREPELIALQLAVNEVLNSFGIKSNQPHSNYFPHITWARCNTETPPAIRVLPTAEFWSSPNLFALSLGKSSPYGIYRKRLFPNE